jgi:beta,beta-carotene 9',10'-dioxygenase
MSWLTTMLFLPSLLAAAPASAFGNYCLASLPFRTRKPIPSTAYNIKSLPLQVQAKSSDEISILGDEETAESSTNVNFDDWIADAPTEITEWTSCPVKGTIPDYVDGTLIRNGGAIWSTPNGEMYSHIFDGLAKIHAYRIHSSSVAFQARFLKGKWYNEFLKTNGQSLPVGIGTGPMLDKNGAPKTGFLRELQALYGSATKFDNACVNIWDWTPNTRDPARKKVTALTDAPPRTTIDFDTMDTISSSIMNSLASGWKGYELAITAHPIYAQTSRISSASSVDTYNVAVELGFNGPHVNLVKETSEGDRSIVSTIALDDGKIPYFHSFGLSKNYAVIVIQPIRLYGAVNKMVELGFMRSMEHVDYTRVVLIELMTGKVVLDKSIDEKVYFYHSISQSECVVDNEGLNSPVVSLRLCAYDTPYQITGEHQFMRLEQCRKGKQWRNKLHKGGKFCDVICNVEDQSVEVKWNDQIQQGFELPTTRCSRAFNGDVPVSPNEKEGQTHPRYVYGFGAFALGSPEYDNWGVFKFDMKENKIDACFHQDSVYLSEPIFIADPDGLCEDDGVLLCQAYFGREQVTKLLVLDAKTMKVLAEASTGARAPMDFHGAWIPTIHDSPNTGES